MEDRSNEIISQYEMKIYRSYRARGGVILETDRGLRFLSPCRASERRLEFEDALKMQIREHGYKNIDNCVRNTQQKLVSVNSVGERYYLREWYALAECSLRQEESVVMAAENLALLHLAMSGIRIGEDGMIFEEEDPLPILERRNRELKRVQGFLAKRKNKSGFEVKYLNCCGSFYEEALRATEELRGMNCSAYLEECIRYGNVAHGAYTYHNILMDGDVKRQPGVSPWAAGHIATVNFEQASFGMQINDLYQYLRKVMEKNNWNQELGKRLLNAYENVRALSVKEKQMIKILLMYPEKFWKVTNYYYNSRKSLIPQKNIEKLEMLLMQQKKKEEFLHFIQCSC